ncbi:MAG: tungsten ABC transporter substrate-binding protein [Chloroflexi bacterium HGW-Chloroflexi-10]|nr:MAG: tungsten ABC transporter substrate-binding protein [Chloroflexi bacterium HGW-Chloroflexi-10]
MNSYLLKFPLFLSLILAFLLSACVSKPSTTSVNTELILATTTSTRDSGLLDELLPLFEVQSGYNVKMVAVGSGQALAMGQEGNADVLLVHAPASEIELMNNGFGLQRDLIMHNDFVIVGPEDDPAGIKALSSSTTALKRIADNKSVFVSRGDDSGTHKKEIDLWENTGFIPESDWYLQTGQGMGETLRIASEKSGYTLTDRATYLAQKSTLQLDVLLEGDSTLLNIYHVIVVNPKKWPKVNVEGAKAFDAFLTSAEIQKMIGEFGTKEYGQPLFFADAGKDEASLGK